MSTQTATTTKRWYYADTALAPSEREIRLIELLPGLPSAEIQCTLKKVSLKDNPSYETISYAWGRPGDTKTILVNGTSIKIPANLENAFRHLRRADISLTIWADSMCINQRDEAEKTWQVAMMGDIYSSCSSVYIWLGVPQNAAGLGSEENGFVTETLINPFTLGLHFANNCHSHELPCFQQSDSPGQWQYVASPLFQSIWSVHIEVITQAWWSRLWCVQEGILSPNAIVVFGRWRVPLATLQLAVSRHAQHTSGCCSHVAALFPASFYSRSDPLLLSIQLDPENGGDSPRNVSSDFDKVFRTFRYKLSQNPRDRIYGLLGLLDSGLQPPIIPDYTRRIDQVFLHAMEAVMARSDGDLRYLTGSGFHSQEYGLPSWVRNFAAPISQEMVFEEMVRYEAYGLYNAAASTQADPKRIRDSILSLVGVQIDKIAEVSSSALDLQVTGDTSDNTLVVVLSWFETAKGVDMGDFCRVVVADNMVMETQRCRRLTAEDVPRTGITWDNHTTPKFTGNPPRSMERSIHAATYGRSMFITEAGHIGLCLPESQVGDEIWVLHGGKVPFVLRSDDTLALRGRNGDTTQPRKLIGDAYLRGFMDGEAMSGTDYVTQEVMLS